MVCLAGLYLLMGAEFIAAVQIIVYGGAIMVLFIFVIMLLSQAKKSAPTFPKSLNSRSAACSCPHRGIAAAS